MMVGDVTGRVKKALPFVFAGLIGTNIGEAIRMTTGRDTSERALAFIQVLPEAFRNCLPSLYPFDLLVGVIIAVILVLVIKVKRMDAKKYRQGVEYGSARWSA